jgi:hypothetical protein
MYPVVRPCSPVGALPCELRMTWRAGAILVSEATLKACSEDPDACEVGEIIARSIATGDNALVIATEREAELEALPFSFFKKAIYSRCALES